MLKMVTYAMKDVQVPPLHQLQLQMVNLALSDTIVFQATKLPILVNLVPLIANSNRDRAHLALPDIIVLILQ